MKVERKADHAVGEAPCKSATGKTLADWLKALDKHGGVALGRRTLGQWLPLPDQEHQGQRQDLLRRLRGRPGTRRLVRLEQCTVMVSVERLQTRAEADGYRRAWKEALDRLKGVLEAG